MSEEVLLNWDDEVAPIDESGPRVITDYGAMQYLGAKKVQLFSTGNSVSWPSLVIDGKPFERKGMKEGHAQGAKNAVVHPIAYFGLAFTDDKPFTTVRMFTTMNGIPVDADKVDSYPVIALDEKQRAAKEAGKTVWVSDWSNLQFIALKQLDAATREKFVKGEKIYFRADNWNTGSKPREDNQGRTNEDGTPKKYYDHYWFNFTIYPDEAAMLAARAAAKGSNGVAPVSYDHYPVQWKSAPASLAPFIKGEFARGQAKAQVVADAMLADKRIDDSGPVDVDSLLKEILAGEVPGPMLDAWLKA